MIPTRVASVFRKGSRTYFFSSLFFPPRERDDVFTLYAFVRVCDDFVDQVPQDSSGFERFVSRYRSALDGEAAGDVIIDGYVDLANRHGFDPQWTESFFSAMRLDLTKHHYETLDELEGYMHGSAEVIGLMMARVLELRRPAYTYAMRLGTAMQYLNFLRDVDHDSTLGRTYIPREVLDRYGLEAPSRAESSRNRDGFENLMRQEVQRYRHWQEAAAEGYGHLPRRYRVPIQTAADMYSWTASVIEAEPMRVFDGQIRPSVARIIGRLARNAVGAATQPQEEDDASDADPVRPPTG